MQRSSTVHKRLTPGQREKILGDYHRSGLPQRDFALQAGISVSALQLWLRKAAAAPGTPPGSFIAVPNLLAPAAPPAVYRLHLGGGLMLEIGPGFRSEELAALLALLPALCSR